MIAIAILRPTFTRSFYTESDAFLNLKKKSQDRFLHACITQLNQLIPVYSTHLASLLFIHVHVY